MIPTVRTINQINQNYMILQSKRLKKIRELYQNNQKIFSRRKTPINPKAPKVQAAEEPEETRKAQKIPA